MSEALTSVPQENPTFRLTGGSSGFCDRSRDIFAQLDSAAKLTSKDLGEDNILDGTFARPAPPSPPPPAAKRKCGQETTKKQPPGKKLPDYLGRPERWTHYSLEDVAETSDRENSQVAHQYIQAVFPQCNSAAFTCYRNYRKYEFPNRKLDVNASQVVFTTGKFGNKFDMYI
uniref:U5 small nuclear ribonucleoprotein TSSC4 n=1 Tax=Sinocyclocheilus rhinocerous TaxID=307959 RepID=A0A673K3R2_9TELE